MVGIWITSDNVGDLQHCILTTLGVGNTAYLWILADFLFSHPLLYKDVQQGCEYLRR